MREFYYDLHLHSCLSPCGDEDNTPNNIAGMAKLCGLDIIALTDHNTCKNCPAFFEAAEKYELIPVAGMELTTAEDIHVVCLFPELDNAMRFDKHVDSLRTKIKNRPEIFGEQIIVDGNDCPIGSDGYLLPNATSISIEDLPELVSEYGGACYPAHIDKHSNGMIAILGTFPPTPHFSAFELHSRDRAKEYTERFGLSDKLCIVSSDAHYLTDMKDAENSIMLDCDPLDHSAVRRALISKLGGPK